MNESKVVAEQMEKSEGQSIEQAPKKLKERIKEESYVELVSNPGEKEQSDRP